MSIALATSLRAAEPRRTPRRGRENSRLGFRVNFPRSRRAKRPRSARGASTKRLRLRRTRAGATIWKKVNGTLVQQWVYGDDLRIVAELDGAGNVVSRFVWASDFVRQPQVVADLLSRVGLSGDVLGTLLAASGVPGSRTPMYMLRAGSVYRFVADHLGSPRLLVDVVSGVIAERNDYNEWGLVLAGGSGFIPHGFAAGLADADAGLVRFGARDYDSTAGRWTSPDPHGANSNAQPMMAATTFTNLYWYVRNDPVNTIDPRGTVPAALCEWLGGTTFFSCTMMCTAAPWHHFVARDLFDRAVGNVPADLPAPACVYTCVKGGDALQKLCNNPGGDGHGGGTAGGGANGDSSFPDGGAGAPGGARGDGTGGDNLACFDP